MQAEHAQEAAMRKEARDTLKVNRAASYEVVLGNWRYRRHDAVDEAESACLAAIYEQERAAAAAAHPAAPPRAWWRFW